MEYDVADTDKGNSYKANKLLTAFDSDAFASVDLLLSLKNCNGRIGATGMCLGGHLAFRVRLIPSSCDYPFLRLTFATAVRPRRPHSRLSLLLPD